MLAHRVFLPTLVGPNSSHHHRALGYDTQATRPSDIICNTNNRLETLYTIMLPFRKHFTIGISNSCSQGSIERSNGSGSRSLGQK